MTTEFAVAGAALAAFVATLTVVLKAAFVVLDRKLGGGTEGAEDLHAKIARLEITVQSLPSLWETERQRMEQEAERAAKRYASARAAESRARALSEASEDEDGDDGDGQGVLPFDGDGGDPRGMLALPGHMASPQPHAGGASPQLLSLLLNPINGRGV